MSCSGTITIGMAANSFRNTLRELLQNGTRRLLIDLGEITYLDSTGIGELVGAYTTAHTMDAQLKLARLPEKVRTLLEITRLITVFEVHPDVASAISSYK